MQYNYVSDDNAQGNPWALSSETAGTVAVRIPVTLPGATLVESIREIRYMAIT